MFCNVVIVVLLALFQLHDSNADSLIPKPDDACLAEAGLSRDDWEQAYSQSGPSHEIYEKSWCYTYCTWRKIDHAHDDGMLTDAYVRTLNITNAEFWQFKSCVEPKRADACQTFRKNIECLEKIQNSHANTTDTPDIESSSKREPDYDCLKKAELSRDEWLLLFSPSDRSLEIHEKGWCYAFCTWNKAHQANDFGMLIKEAIERNYAPNMTDEESQHFYECVEQNLANGREEPCKVFKKNFECINEMKKKFRDG